MAGADMVGNTTEILRLMDEACQGDRQVIVYPDLAGFRKIYSMYAKKRLEKDNEVVVLFPYYETSDSVIAVLQRNGIDVEKYGRRGFLIIRDAYKTYSGFTVDRELMFMKILSHAAATGKTGISIILDMGAFDLIAGVHKIAMSYESILPQRTSLNVTAFLSYHKDDYARLSQEQKSIRFTENYKTLLVNE